MSKLHWIENTPKTRRARIDFGWLTPDTYGNNFACLEPIPAVYSLVVFGRDKYGLTDFDRFSVAYVGMSLRLSERLAGHEILRELRSKFPYVQRHFKPTPEDELRAQERELIQKINPPWNIALRVRGVAP